VTANVSKNSTAKLSTSPPFDVWWGVLHDPAPSEVDKHAKADDQDECTHSILVVVGTVGIEAGLPMSEQDRTGVEMNKTIDMVRVDHHQRQHRDSDTARDSSNSPGWRQAGRGTGSGDIAGCRREGRGEEVLVLGVAGAEGSRRVDRLLDLLVVVGEDLDVAAAADAVRLAGIETAGEEGLQVAAVQAGPVGDEGIGTAVARDTSPCDALSGLSPHDLGPRNIYESRQTTTSTPEFRASLFGPSDSTCVTDYEEISDEPVLSFFSRK